MTARRNRQTRLIESKRTAIAAIQSDIHGHWTLDDERWASHFREHHLIANALVTATDALDKRIEGLNEFRGQLTDQSKTFVTRDLHDRLESDLDRRIDDLATVTNRRFEDQGKINGAQAELNARNAGKGTGQAAVIGAIVVGLTIAGTIVAIAVAVLPKK